MHDNWWAGKEVGWTTIMHHLSMEWEMTDLVV